MANAEPQKQLLSLIRDFATEKSHGERRVSDLRKRLVELQSDLDSANADLASAKRAKEMVEEELQGSQAHLAMIDASVLVIEGRINRLQEEISKAGSDLAALKREEDVQRDDFINRMSGLNAKIRLVLSFKVYTDGIALHIGRQLKLGLIQDIMERLLKEGLLSRATKDSYTINKEVNSNSSVVKEEVEMQEIPQAEETTKTSDEDFMYMKDIGSYVMKVPLLIFQVLLCMRLEVDGLYSEDHALIVVGSYVPKTTKQVEELKSQFGHNLKIIEITYP